MNADNASPVFCAHCFHKAVLPSLMVYRAVEVGENHYYRLTNRHTTKHEDQRSTVPVWFFDGALRALLKYVNEKRPGWVFVHYDVETPFEETQIELRRLMAERQRLKEEFSNSVASARDTPDAFGGQKQKSAAVHYMHAIKEINAMMKEELERSERQIENDVLYGPAFAGHEAFVDVVLMSAEFMEVCLMGRVYRIELPKKSKEEHVSKITVSEGGNTFELSLE